jgi:hypothetical protein
MNMAKQPSAPKRSPKSASTTMKLPVQGLSEQHFKVNDAGKLSIDRNQLSNLINEKMTNPMVINRGNLAATEVEVSVKVKF